VNRWTQAFLPLRDPVQPEKVTEAGASDRWAYHLRGLEATLTGLTDDAIAAEIRRQVNRAEQPTRRRLGEPSEAKEDEKAGEILSRSFLAYRDFFEERKEALTPACRDRKPSAIQWFLTLCQTASFLARGRDQ
jgi:CRISPR-associated protein Cmr2